MARNVSDCAFFLSVLAGYDTRSPIAIDGSGAQFAKPLDRNFKGTRVAMFKDMGLPWEPAVRDAVRAQAKVFESLGCIVEDAEPDLHDADECFLAWRHWSEELGGAELADKHPDLVNDYVHWHVDEGRKLTGPYLSRIEEKRTKVYRHMQEFMSRYDYFVLPVNQVLPFDITIKYPTEIAGTKMETYIAWMKSAYWISTVGNPAMSVPCAFSSTGLPIGIQIVGRHHDDWGVLQMGYAFEQATLLTKKRPPIAV
jgi:amidase